MSYIICDVLTSSWLCSSSVYRWRKQGPWTEDCDWWNGKPQLPCAGNPHAKHHVVQRRKSRRGNWENKVSAGRTNHYILETHTLLPISGCYSVFWCEDGSWRLLTRKSLTLPVTRAKQATSPVSQIKTSSSKFSVKPLKIQELNLVTADRFHLLFSWHACSSTKHWWRQHRRQPTSHRESNVCSRMSGWWWSDTNSHVAQKQYINTCLHTSPKIGFI